MSLPVKSFSRKQGNEDKWMEGAQVEFIPLFPPLTVFKMCIFTRNYFFNPQIKRRALLMHARDLVFPLFQSFT